VKRTCARSWTISGIFFTLEKQSLPKMNKNKKEYWGTKE